MAKNYLDHPTMWEDGMSYLFLNPRLQEAERKAIEQAVDCEDRENTIWLKTSGTEMAESHQHKLVALEKRAVLCAAQSVNRFFELGDRDVWLNSLPLFHVGGLAVYARAYLSKAKVIDSSDKAWDVENFSKSLQAHNISLTSLVPTQVYDLVKKRVSCPPVLRFVFVGGGALDPETYIQARNLGWPLIISYGMTETSAMIATSRPLSLSKKVFPEMELLPHIRIEKRENGLSIQSDSILSGYLFVGTEETRWVSFEKEFLSDDRVQVDGKNIRVLGRSSDLVKVLGETVDILSLEKRFSAFYKNPFVIVAQPESRRGFNLVLVSEEKIPERIIKNFNDEVMPYERLEKVKQLDKLPRTPLGKILKKEIVDQLT